MASIASLTVRVGSNIGPLLKGLDKAERSLTRSARNMQRTGAQLSQTISAPLALFGAAAVKSFADIQLLTNGLESMLGSSAAAKAELEKLNEAAKLPGLGFEQSIRGSLQLQSVGVSADGARRQMIAFGNALALAGKSGAELDGVVLALTQITSSDKLLTQDVRQLTSRIPQLSKILKDEFGTAIPQAIAESGVSTKEFVARIIPQLEKLPKATGGITNAFENFGNASKRSLAVVGESIADTLNLTENLDRLSGIIDSAANGFARLPGPLQTAIIGFAGLAAAVGPALIAIGGTKLIMAQAVGGISTVVGAARSATVAFLAMDAAAKFTTIGAAIAVFAAVGGAVYYLSTQYTAAEKAQQKLDSTIASATGSIAGQKAQVSALASVLEDSAASDQKKITALNKLKEISPDYFNGLTLAKGQVEGLTGAVDGYINSLLKQAKTQALVSAITEADQALEKLKATGEGAELTYFQQAKAAVLGFGNVGRTVGLLAKDTAGNFKSASDSLIQEKERLTKALTELVNTDVSEGATKGGSNLGGETGRKPIIVPLAIEQTDALKQIQAFTAGAAERLANAPFEATLKVGFVNSVSPAIRQIQFDLNTAIDEADDFGKAFGDSFDVSAAKSTALKNAIQAMIREGVNPASPAIQALQDQLNSFTIDPAIATLESLSNSITSAIQGTLSNVTAAFGEGLANLLDGSAGFGDFTAGILSTLGSGLKEMGKLITAYGFSMVTFKAAFSNPLAAIAAGAALTVAGTLVQNKAQKLQATPFANGGIVSGPTLGLVGEYPGARSNPEVIAPLDRLKSMIGDTTQAAINLMPSIRYSLTDMYIELQKVQGRANQLV